MNNIIDNVNFPDQKTNKFSLFNSQKKWALWPEDMTFLEMLQIPQEIFFKKLIAEIQTTYKGIAQTNQNTQSNENNPNNLSQAQLALQPAISNFVKDVDIEMTEYQRKYNLILISDNFPRKQECLLKIKDNMKKLIYLKSTVSCWASKI